MNPMRRLRSPARSFSLSVRRFDTIKNVLSAGWPVEATEDIQQRGFPRAGWTGYRQPFATPQHEVDIDQCVDRGIGPELLAHFTQVEDMVGIGRKPP